MTTASRVVTVLSLENAFAWARRAIEVRQVSLVDQVSQVNQATQVQLVLRARRVTEAMLVCPV